MTANSTKMQDMVGQVSRLSLVDGYNETPLSRLRLYREVTRAPCSAQLYDPSLVFILQGKKNNVVGGRSFEWGENTMLTVTLPCPMEAEIIEASPEKPFLAVVLALDIPELSDLLHDSARRPNQQSDKFRILETAPVTDDQVRTLSRLIALLPEPQDLKILGNQICRELVYYTLKSSPDGALTDLLKIHGPKLRVARTIEQIHAKPEMRIDIDTLAEKANMSKSTFFSLFKEMTSHSPIQYQKSMRLHRARRLIVSEGYQVGEAAYAVGYTSLSQFSREYTRFFKVPASQELVAG